MGLVYLACPTMLVGAIPATSIWVRQTKLFPRVALCGMLKDASINPDAPQCVLEASAIVANRVPVAGLHKPG